MQLCLRTALFLAREVLPLKMTHVFYPLASFSEVEAERDMSIVGPRPLTPDILELYSEEHAEQIIGVRPGSSGIGSIVFRDEETFDWRSSRSKELLRESNYFLQRRARKLVCRKQKFGGLFQMHISNMLSCYYSINSNPRCYILWVAGT